MTEEVSVPELHKGERRTGLKASQQMASITTAIIPRGSVYVVLDQVAE